MDAAPVASLCSSKHTVRGHLAKSWAQRISLDGRQRNLGLGSWPHVSLAEAREKCALNLAARRRGELVTGRKRTVPTFEEAVEKVIAVHRAGWKDGSRSEEDWRGTLRDYAVPKLGGRPVDRITTADVMEVLLPIWNEKRVTARRVRQRIGVVMRWAVAQGYREDNPAGEAIGAALPKNGVRPQHLAALPYAEVAGAMEPGARLRGVSRNGAGLRVPGPDGVPERRGARRAVGGDGP